MPRPGHLAQVIDWAHHFLSEIILTGDRLVDLTAGNGYDTLFLANQLDGTGQLLAFDVQMAALDSTAERLAASGHTPYRVTQPQLLADPGIFLIEDGHQALDDYLVGETRGGIANLGYLPGSDKTIVTRPETTIAAVQAVLASLMVGGRLAVVVYRGHPGGEEESTVIEAFLAGLSPELYDVLRLKSTNRINSPYLLLVERRA